jgi:hypothetical protein
MHHQYGMIQVQLVLDGPYEGGDGETKNINDRYLNIPSNRASKDSDSGVRAARNNA